MPKDLFTESATAAPGYPMPTIDMTREAHWLARLLGGLKMTPEGRAGYLEHAYGQGNVATDKSGAQYIYDPTKNQYFPYNKPGFTWRDVPSVSGEFAVRALPQLAAGSNPYTAGLAGAAGSLAQQGISSLIPGKDQMSLMQRGADVGISALTAGAGQYAINQAARLWDWMRPHNVVARYVNKAEQTPLAKQGAAMSKATGIPLTPGQQTSSRGVVMAEGLLRRHPATAQKLADFDTQQLSKSVQYLTNQLDNISTSPGSSEAAGNRIVSTFKDTVAKALQVRRTRALADFGAVDQASGGAKIIPLKNTFSEIDDLISRFDTPGTGDASQALVSKLKQIKSGLAGTPSKTVTSPIVDEFGNAINTTTPGKPAGATANQFQRLLQVYGDAATGSGAIFKDIDKAQQRLIAGRIFKALQSDLDEAANLPMASQDAAAALQKARANYRANSKALGTLRESVLGKMIGEDATVTPERIAERFRNLRGSEIRNAFSILDSADPSTAQSVKRYLVQNAMERAGVPPSKRIPGQENFSPAKFVSELEKSPVWEVFSPSERAQMKMAINIFGRVADKPMEGSPTAPLQFTYEFVKSLGKSAMGLDPLAAAQSIGAFLGPSKVADALLTPAGRKALVALKTTKPGTKAFENALSVFAIHSALQSDEDVRPSPTFDAAMRGSSSTRQPADLLQ